MKGENKLLIEKSLTQTIEKEFFLNVHQNLSAHIQDNTSLKSNSMQTRIEEQYSLESENSTFDFQTDCEVKAGNQILHQVGDTQIVTKKDCVIIKAGGVEVFIDSNGLVVKGGELKAE
ncbi:TPA: type VI secretion protein VgrG [Campylobacter coli]